MNRIFIILFLIFSVASCDTKGWHNIATGEDPEGGIFTISLDRSDITDFESKKTAWVRKSFTNPKKLKNGDTYTETFIFFAVDCNENKYSVIEIGMSNPGSTDFVHTVKFAENIKDLLWKDVPDNIPSKKIYEELCTWYKSYI